MLPEGLGAPMPGHESGRSLAEPGEEILNSPSVLRGLGLDIERKFSRLENDFYITPVARIEDTDLGLEASVRLGRQRDTAADNALYVVDDTGALRPWYYFYGDSIVRGDDQPVRDSSELSTVRKVLKLVERELDKSVRAPLDAYDLRARMDEGLSGDITALEAQLALLRGLRDAKETRGQGSLTVQVNIRSGWEREGEKNLSRQFDSNAPLVSILGDAVTAFKELNGRSDVQGELQISVAEGGVSYHIPREVWTSFFQSISVGKGFYEQNAIRQEIDAGNTTK